MKLGTITAALATLLVATTVFAQTISFDFDKTVDFAGFRTYAWAAGTNVPEPLVHERIVNAVDVQMSLKGLQQVHHSSTPDVLVAYHAAFDRDLQVSGFGTGWGPYRWGGTRSVSARTEEIVVGTMIVDLIDARTNRIIWRGTATRDVDMHASPEKRDRNISRTTEKLFKHYPPKAR